MPDAIDAPVETVPPNPQDHDGDPPEKGTRSAPASTTPRAVERESEERRDDRDVERPVKRRGRGGDYDERSRSTSCSASPREKRRSASYKRSRREDGGYDGGRGDRRFGYDGGHQCGTGGRYPYADERRYGRDIGGGYQNDLQDWEAARGGGGNKNGSGTNLKSDGLMSYKQFIQQAEDDIQPSEAERRYQKYKSEYISTQKKSFFKLHKEEEWLKDKYHPTNLLAVIERRNEHAQKAAHDFLLALRSGSLNLCRLNEPALSGKSNYDNKPDSGTKRKDNNRGTAKETAPKAHAVSSEPRRVLIDIEQAQALIQKLDSEKGIVENILRGTWHEDSKGSTGPVIFVRGLNFVKGLEGTELLDTLTTYLWSIHSLNYYGMVETSEPKGLRHITSEAPVSDATSDDGAEWKKNLDNHWKERLNGQDPLELMTAQEKIDSAAVRALDLYVRKVRDSKLGWKFGCGAKDCTKLFYSSKYVHKHLKLNHPEVVVELTSKIREALYFENYMNDPNAPRSKPVLQKTITERTLRLQNRLKDNRGILQDHDSITPTILMPVAGAGPLGPFVPAPPEVARRMLRGQGGQAFNQDPRQLVSYTDLDRPEDAVTVMDYRSLDLNQADVRKIVVIGILPLGCAPPMMWYWRNVTGDGDGGGGECFSCGVYYSFKDSSTGVCLISISQPSMIVTHLPECKYASVQSIRKL